MSHYLMTVVDSTAATMAEVSHEATIVALPQILGEDESRALPEEVPEVAESVNNDKLDETEGLAEIEAPMGTNETSILPPRRLDDEALRIPAAVTMDRKDYL
jgi:hypothetical protein